jgi:hypothetical protein
VPGESKDTNMIKAVNDRNIAVQRKTTNRSIPNLPVRNKLIRVIIP